MLPYPIKKSFGDSPMKNMQNNDEFYNIKREK